MLFEVILRQSYQTRNVLNRWHYNGSGTPAAVQMSFALASAFGGIQDGITGEFPEDSVMEFLRSMQAEPLLYLELQVAALYDVSDFYVIPYNSSAHGASGGTAMSPFAAYGFQSNRVRTDIRRGNKRICGVVEGAVKEFGEIESTIMPSLVEIGDAFSATLEYDDEGNTLSFQPAVLSFQKHAPDADHDTDWYSKYSTNTAQLEHTALGITWQPKPYITTQNSRKN